MTIKLAGRWLAVVCMSVILLSFLVRFVIADDQSYWYDELFRVYEVKGSLVEIGEEARRETIPPTYATLLFLWVRFGQFFGLSGTSELWTHVLSLLLVSVGTVGAWLGLRRAGISPAVMWAGLTAVSLSGFTLVYSLETRDYALLLAGSLGATAYAAVIVTQLRRGDQVDAWWTWTAWGFVAASSHVFGALLVLCQAGALLIFATDRRSRHLMAPLARSVLLAISVQVLWLGYGLVATSGFAQATSWIEAPGLSDIVHWFTTAFASGYLRMDPGGYVWIGRLGVLVVFVLLIAAAVMHALTRPDRSSTESESDVSESERADLVVAQYLATVAVAMFVGVFLISQLVHVWTLRNMIAVLPAVSWATVFFIVWLARTPVLRMVMAWTIVVAAGAGAVVALSEMTVPYKKDVRAFGEYYLAMREADPEAVYQYGKGGRRMPYLLAFATQQPVELFESGKATAVDGNRQLLIGRGTSGGDPAQYRRRLEKLERIVDRDDCIVVYFPLTVALQCPALE